ncbi:MAG: hypothetical protein ACRER5_09190, partial [Pseudomonas sp.]
ILSHKALMVAYGKGERSIDASYVRSAAEDTEGVVVPAVSYHAASLAGVGMTAGLILIVYLINYYSGGTP